MKIHLLINLKRNGVSNGTTPAIQDLEYWVENGYRFIAFVSDCAITLCKSNVGNIGEHCSYSSNVLKYRQFNLNIKQ